ncbi:MAG TPA: efflux RND transporter periplasmic adaptor subunit, partial [Acidobacteriota bacterium]|nr:efflux RND transporter periplasmic adaptor subunit [Acidobacteriota bacterium]
IQLTRLGGRVDRFQFKKEGDYLRGNGVVEEPHSFDVSVSATYKGENFHWKYPSYEGRTTMTDEGIKNAGIKVETAGPSEVKTVVDLPGEIILNPDRQTHVLPRFNGIVTSVSVNLGDRVTKGQALANMESMELADEKSDYVKAMHKYEFARKAYEREQALWEKRITSEQDYLAKKNEYEEAKIHFEAAGQKLKAAGIPSSKVESSNQLSTHLIRSPIAGAIIEKNVATGQAVQSMDKLFVVADLSSLYAEITIPAQMIGAVRQGQKVRVVSDVLNTAVEGQLTYVGPLLGEKTRSSKGRVLISNTTGNWKPGVFVKVFVVQEEARVPLAVKISGLQTFRDWNGVFLAVGNTFEIRPLELGRRDEEWVEVLSGISPGDRYVTENSFVVKADVEKSGATHAH